MTEQLLRGADLLNVGKIVKKLGYKKGRAAGQKPVNDGAVRFRSAISSSAYDYSAKHLVLTGWAVGAGESPTIQVFVDGSHIGNAVGGFARPDVIDSFPQYENIFCGWYFCLRMEPLTTDSKVTVKYLDGEKLLGEGVVPLNVKTLDTSIFETENYKSSLKHVSETSKCRSSLADFCIGNGLDIGFGGDPIVPHAMRMDLPNAYAKYSDIFPQQLHGDCRNLEWFKDNSLDFVYSSHVLEDFKDIDSLFDEWVRVIRPGGHLVLFLPDEPTYRADCAKRGVRSNPYHHYENFGFEFIEKLVNRREGLEIIHHKFPVGVYSFEVVVKKLGKGNNGNPVSI